MLALTRGERRALLFLSLSFVAGLLLLGWQALGREDVSWSLTGVAVTVAPTPRPALVVDINRATAVELAALPGIGQIYAQRIVRRREIRGRFARVEELLTVDGIGPKRLERIRRMVCVK